MLATVRSAVFMLVMFLFTLIFWPLALAVYFCEPKRRSRIIGAWAYVMVWVLRVVCGLRHEVKGLENLPDQPAVIFSKHQSAWETIAYQTIFPPQAWVLKKSLLRIPFFGWGLAATKPIVINRETARKALEQVVKQGSSILKQGRWVVIFPEGTRITPGEHGTYYTSASLLAFRADVPLVPVAHNAGDFWRKRGLTKHPGTIQVRIGKPIYPIGLKPRELNKMAEDWIRKTMPEISSAYKQEPLDSR